MADTHRPGFRVSPPPLSLDDDLRWLLTRAFGPTEIACPTPQPATALRVAHRTGLAPRIAWRTSSDVLGREVDKPGLATARRQALTHYVAYEQLLDRVTEIAGRLDVPVVLLKGMALVLGGFSAAGSREIGDLDLLVDPDVVEDFADELEGHGFRPGTGRRNEQHLAPLLAPDWGVIDLHFTLRGVSTAGEGWATAAEILAVGTPQEARPKCWVPDPAMLAAHAMAHGFDQHALTPSPYPLLRTLGDLMDVLPSETAWREAHPRFDRWLARTLSSAEIDAVCELCSLLSRGRVPATNSGPGLLLSHFLNHALDDGYRKTLAGRHRRHRLRQARARGTLLRYVGGKLADLWRRHLGRTDA